MRPFMNARTHEAADRVGKRVDGEGRTWSRHTAQKRLDQSAVCLAVASIGFAPDNRVEELPSRRQNILACTCTVRH